MQHMATLSGLPLDVARFLVLFILQHPLGWFFHYIVHGELVRHLFHIIVGGAIQYYCFRESVLAVWVLTGVAYLLMALLPRKRQGPIVMAWVMAHLSYSHVVRMLADLPFSADVTSFTML